jgi:type II secretory pathway component PulF
MPLFKYRAKKGPEEYLSGEIEAESAGVVRLRLKEEGLFPLSIEDADALEEKSGGAREALRSFGRKANSEDLAMFARQLGNLIGAGVPALKCLDTLTVQTENRHLRQGARRLAEDLRRGTTLAEAMRRQPEIFPAAFAASVHAGETGGTLDSVLNTLADHYETEGELWSSVKAALIYPCFLLIAGTITVYVLLTFVIPHFIELFREFGNELPWPTVALLTVSGFLSKFWWAVPVALLIGIGSLRRYAHTAEGGLALDRLRIGLPLLGRLTHKTEMAKFARTLGMLLKSGVSVVEAMRIAANTLRNRAVIGQVELAREEVRQGKRIADSLAEAKYFPLMLTNLVSVGEQTGDLPGVFGKAADIYEKDVQRYSRVLAKMLEPAMIVLVGGVVGFIVIATLLPVFRISAMVK